MKFNLGVGMKHGRCTNVLKGTSRLDDDADDDDTFRDDALVVDHWTGTTSCWKLVHVPHLGDVVASFWGYGCLLS